MRKTVDMNEIANEVAAKMAGRKREYTLAPDALNPGVVQAPVEMRRTASDADMLSGHKSVKLEGLDHTVLNREDATKEIMQTVQKKTAALAAVLPKIAAEARKRGLTKIAEKADELQKALDAVSLAKGLAEIKKLEVDTQTAQELAAANVAQIQANTDATRTVTEKEHGVPAPEQTTAPAAPGVVLESVGEK